MGDDDWGMDYAGLGEAAAAIHTPAFQGGGVPLFTALDGAYGALERAAGLATGVMQLRTNYTIDRLNAEARIAEARARLASVPVSTWLMVGIAAIGLYFTAKAAG